MRSQTAAVRHDAVFTINPGDCEAANMTDDALPASLQRLHIDRLSTSCPHIATTDKPNTTNPFRTLSRTYPSVTDNSWLFRRRSMPNRPTVFAANPRGIKSTTNFKPSKSERVVAEKSKRSTVLREAILKLNAPGTGCLSDNLVDTLKNSCKFSISSKSSKRIESESIARDLKELEMRRDCRQTKDDTSIQDDDYEAGGYQRTRSNTMPSLKRGPGPGGGQTDAAGPSGGQPSSTNTCSVQARISPPSCDITIGELASYFEEFVHIPKKMSHMAEMMFTHSTCIPRIPRKVSSCK